MSLSSKLDGLIIIIAGAKPVPKSISYTVVPIMEYQK